MYFPGGSYTRENPLPYKYTEKPTDFRLPHGLEDGSQRWNWRYVRCSVRLFYKLYHALFACSIKMNFCTFDLQLNVVMTSTIDISTIVLRTARVARTDLVYWKDTLFSQLISVVSTALILSYNCLWNAQSSKLNIIFPKEYCLVLTTG